MPDAGSPDGQQVVGALEQMPASHASATSPHPASEHANGEEGEGGERILSVRFGLGTNKDHTLEEVGLQFSVTRERIRQIEAKALRKLRHPSRSRILRSFLDH